MEKFLEAFRERKICYRKKIKGQGQDSSTFFIANKTGE